MSLTIDSGFDLSCLGAIQFIIRDRATVQYGNGANDRLTLAEGSSIIVLAGGRIDGGSGCNSSDRIYIGTKLVATCSGNANTESSFSDIVSLGGTGSVNSNSPVCVGNSINLTANPPPNGMFDYSWTGPDNFSSILQNPSAFPATSLSGGKYSLVMTRTNDGQKAYSEVTVVVNPVPTTAIAGSNQSQCNTSSFTLSGNAPTIGTGAWSVVIGTATITTAASRTSGVTGVAVGTSATLRWTITNGTCTSRSDVILTNNALPTITGTLNVCLGATIALTGSGTADTTTPWTSGTPSFATVSNSGVVSGIASGTSVITYKNNNGCTITATVTVNSLPNNTTNGFVATTICTGGSPQLTFDAEDSSFSLPYNISYKNVSTGNSYTVSIPSAAPFSFTPGDNPISDAVYRLVSINKAGCERTTGFGKTSAELRVRPIPTALISGASAVCVGSTLPNIIISNPRTNQITVSYSINNMVQTSVDIRAGEQISLQALTTTAGDFIYQLISVVYTFSPSCSTALSDNVKVTINALPTITSATAAASPICTNTITTLTANGVTGAGITLTWWSGTGGTGTNYGTGLTLPNAGPGTYFARVTGTCTLAVEASVIVTEQALPNAGTNGTLTVCAGTTPTNAQLFGALLGTPTAGGSWSAPVAGVYTYTVAATAPCTVNATATVTVTQQALPNAGINGTLTVCAGTTLNNTQLFAALLGTPTAGGSWSAPVADVYTYTVAATAPCTVAATATVTVDETAPVADAGAAFTKTCTSNPDGKTIGVAPVADVTYAWLPIAGLSNAAIANPTANPTTTTTYTVTATNSTSGCTAISIVLVTVDIATTTWKELTPGTLGWSNGGVPSLNDIIVFAD
ncbi:MAG: hypothetical protein QMB11_05120, partial [Nonlabens sp.]|uniref:hypothetical protein n=1 Tax=Nonlabens sp. TaxID=1888209 RepID=UPI0035A6F4E6